MKAATIEQVLASPCTSFWLKDALESALERDIVNATNDAHLLYVLLKGECEVQLAMLRKNF